MYKIYHNPRCGKSRQTLELLKANVDEKSIEIIEYLKKGLDKKEILSLSQMLNLEVIDFVRKNEADFKPYKSKKLSETELVDLIVAHPILLERPIVIKNKHAIIGRPPENVKKLF